MYTSTWSLDMSLECECYLLVVRRPVVVVAHKRLVRSWKQILAFVHLPTANKHKHNTQIEHRISHCWPLHSIFLTQRFNLCSITTQNLAVRKWNALHQNIAQNVTERITKIITSRIVHNFTTSLLLNSWSSDSRRSSRFWAVERAAMLTKAHTKAKNFMVTDCIKSRSNTSRSEIQTELFDGGTGFYMRCIRNHKSLKLQ